MFQPGGNVNISRNDFENVPFFFLCFNGSCISLGMADKSALIAN